MIPVPEDAPHLADALDSSVRCDGLPLIPIQHLVLMKLAAGRLRDKTDIVSMLRSGADARMLREFVAAQDPALLPALDALIAEALREG